MAPNPIHNLAPVLLLLFFHLSSANHLTGHHPSRHSSRHPSRHSSGHYKNIGPPSTGQASNILPNVNTNNNNKRPRSIGPSNNIPPNPPTTNNNLLVANKNDNEGPIPTSISDPASSIPPDVNTDNNGGGPSPTAPADSQQQLPPPLPITPNASHNGTSNHPHIAHEFVHHHNAVRATVGEQPFSWDGKLARHARRWSDERRGDCELKHSGTIEYGENMFWGSGWDWKPADAVKYWANEHLYYNLTSNMCASGKVCGHFTQMVWNTTVKVGCARAECYNGQTIITCNYFPPGNFLGERPF